MHFSYGDVFLSYVNVLCISPRLVFKSISPKTQNLTNSMFYSCKYSLKLG